MSVKDLNLSLDRQLAHDESALHPPGGADRRPGSGRLKSVAGTAPSGQKPSPRRVRAGNRNRLWVPTALIALVNMLFLVVAGIWLTGPRLTPASNAASAAEVELNQLQTQLDVMQEQLVLVQSTLEEQQRLLILRQLETPPEVTPQAAATAHEDATAETAPALPTWQVHLGHFATRDEAIALQLDLAQLGYTATIAAAATPDEPGVALLLGGFAERDLAELAAKDIMQRTRLNGLWVSTGE
jgi:hypothetical protein